MKTIIVGGFLGAGKTTAVIQLAGFLANQANSTHRTRVVILENEIGEVGVDDMLLRGSGYQVSELFAGCACCTMSGELRGNIRVIQRELDPEWLILEATGVAYPINIKAAVDPLMECPAVICALVDAKRFLRMLRPAGALATAQLTDADVILINKVDLVDEAVLAETERRIRAIGAQGAIVRVCGLQEIDSDVWLALQRMAEGEGKT